MLRDTILTQEQLYAPLRKMRGQKGVILDCCHAGMHIGERTPKDVLVVAASHREAYGSTEGNKHMGVFTRAVVDFLWRYRGKVSLEELITQFAEGLPVSQHHAPILRQYPSVSDSGHFSLMPRAPA